MAKSNYQLPIHKKQAPHRKSVKKSNQITNKNSRVNFCLYKLIFLDPEQISNIDKKLRCNLRVSISIVYFLYIFLIFFDFYIINTNKTDSHIIKTKIIYIIYSIIQCLFLLFVIDSVNEPRLICTTNRYPRVLTHLSYYWQFGIYWLLNCIKFYIIVPTITIYDISYLYNNKTIDSTNIFISDLIHIIDHLVVFYFIYIISLHMVFRNLLDKIDVNNNRTIISSAGDELFINRDINDI